MCGWSGVAVVIEKGREGFGVGKKEEEEVEEEQERKRSDETQKTATHF